MKIMSKISDNNILDKNDMHSKEKVELVHSGEDYFSRLLKIIAGAKKEIHIQVYIFENDTTGKEVVEALKVAASRNVKIYVLVDGYGSSSLSGDFVNDLILHGIDFRVFAPLFSLNNFYLGRRLHHKVVTADSHVALIGGINIANKYRGNDTQIPWLDYALQIEGEIVISLQNLCQGMYFHKKQSRRRGISFSADNGGSMKIIRNDWLKGKNEISNAYIKAIKNAEKEVIIVGSYFLPGRRLMRVMKKASAIKGVKVKLILSGISDVPFINRATSYMYSSLLGNKIELYEWKNSVLHGKAAVVDKQWATVGSFNLNHLSSYGSIELNLEINSKSFSEKFSADLTEVMSQSESITLESLKRKTNFYSIFLSWLSYRFLRMFLIAVIYMPYKRFFVKYMI